MRDARPRRPLLSGVLLAVLLAHAALRVAGAETCEEEGSCSKDEEKGDEDSPEPAPDDTPYVCDFAEGLDFYERLGVPKDADERAIKKAFRKLSLTYHPDKVKGKTEEKECSQSHFIAITKAYETLSDEEKRRKYDLFGDIEDQQGGSGGGGADAFDIFQQFFSRGGAGGGQGGGVHFEFQPFGGFAGGGGAHQFFFEEEDPTEIDIGECVNMCVIQHRQAGHIGDLETHCYHQCAAQVQEEFGQHSAFEHAFGGHGGFNQFHQMGGGGFGGGGFGGGGGGGGADARASVLEHMMRGGGFGGMHEGGFAGGGHYMHDHGYGYEEPGYEPQTETVLMEDEYGNRWYQEVEVDDMQGQHFDHYSGRPAGNRRGGHQERYQQGFQNRRGRSRP